MPVPSSTYNLPGSSFDLADFGLRIAAPTPGRKLTLIGATTATLSGNLLLGEPYGIQSVGTAINSFKNADGTDSELSLAIEMAFAAGAKNVEVIVCATSEPATANARWDALAEVYRNIKGNPTDIVHPVGAYADTEGCSGSDPYGETRTDFRRQLQNFCYRGSKEGNSLQGVIGLTPLLEMAMDEAWTGGPTSEAEVMFATPSLAQINEWVEHVNGQVGDLADHSSDTALAGYVYGSVQASPVLVSANYDGWALEEDGSTGVDHLGNDVDGGRAVAVVGMVARQVLDSTRARAAANGYAGELSQNTNGAVAYAAFLTTIDPNVSPTGKTIKSLVPARKIPVSFAVSMTNARIVTMVTRSSGFVIAKGITGAHNAGPYAKSDYTNWTTFSISLLALDLAREAAEPYIGRQSAPEILNAMQMDIENALHLLYEISAVSELRISIIQSRDQQILGDLDIDINMVPYGEINRINFRQALSRV